MRGVSWPGKREGQGGGIEIWEGGIVVTTECCGCASDPLDERSLILSLYHALGDYLVATSSEDET